MKPHWNAEEFANHVVASREPSHASECPECRAELDEFRSELNRFRQSVQTAAQRPSFFWSTQRTAIEARVRNASRPQTLLYALGSVAALCALAAAMLMPIASPRVETATYVDPDELLMQQVQQTLTSDVASPLRPARLIANEMNQALVAQQKSTTE